MRRILAGILMIGLGLSSVSDALAKDMKELELYSWPVNGEWHFVLLAGTNRLKSCPEITAEERSLKSVDALEKALQQIPKEDAVFWVDEKWLSQVHGATGCNLTLPPQDVVKNIEVFCKNLGVTLSVQERTR